MLEKMLFVIQLQRNKVQNEIRSSNNSRVIRMCSGEVFDILSKNTIDKWSKQINPLKIGRLSLPKMNQSINMMTFEMIFQRKWDALLIRLMKLSMKLLQINFGSNTKKRPTNLWKNLKHASTRMIQCAMSKFHFEPTFY